MENKINTIYKKIAIENGRISYSPLFFAWLQVETEHKDKAEIKYMNKPL